VEDPGATLFSRHSTSTMRCPPFSTYSATEVANAARSVSTPITSGTGKASTPVVSYGPTDDTTTPRAAARVIPGVRATPGQQRNNWRTRGSILFICRLSQRRARAAWKRRRRMQHGCWDVPCIPPLPTARVHHGLPRRHRDSDLDACSRLRPHDTSRGFGTADSSA
jgi:hypothetical protein